MYLTSSQTPVIVFNAQATQTYNLFGELFYIYITPQRYCSPTCIQQKHAHSFHVFFQFLI